MSIVDLDTAIWKDPWFRKLPVKAKHLFMFLWTNDHKNLPCLYEIDLETIKFYAGLSIKEITDTLSLLYPKVKYDFENEVVWVVNFVRHQFLRTKNISPKIEKGIENNLIQMNGHFFVGEFLEIYPTLNIIIKDPIDRVSEGYQYPPGGGGGGGEGKGKEEDVDPKIKHGEFVTLTEKEHQTLIEKYGHPKVEKMIETLDNYKGSSGKTYKSDYRAILMWVVDRVLQDWRGSPASVVEEEKPPCVKCGNPSVAQYDDKDHYCRKHWPDIKGKRALINGQIGRAKSMTDKGE